MRFGFNLRRLPLGNCVPVSLVTLRRKKDNGAIRIVDAHPGDGKRFVRADAKLTAFPGSEILNSQKNSIDLSIGGWQIRTRAKSVGRLQPRANLTVFP
jgi:hypothetical protein